MPDLSLFAQMGTFIVAVVAYFSFAYGRKPLIHIKSSNIADYEFIIKNVSKNPAKNIFAKIKLDYKGNIRDIGKYELDYLNPEAEDVIKDMSEKVESELENINLLIKSPYKWPKNPESYFGDDTIKHIDAIGKGYYKENELKTLHSHKINDNFEISIKFEITCKSDIPLDIPLLNTYKFLYNFKISYTKLDLDFFNKEEPDTYLEISYGCMDNFNLHIQPSTGKWK
jgi:hypothetical protein